MESILTPYFTIPIITRIFLTCYFLIALLLSTKMVAIQSLYYTFSDTFITFQLWRPFTSLFCISYISFSFIIYLIFANFLLSSFQKQIFGREKLADLLTLLLYLFGILIIIASFMDLFFISDIFAFSILYIWCKRKPFQVFTFPLDFTITAGYYPWVVLAYTLLIGQPLLRIALAYFIAHLYLYIKGPLISKYNIDFLPTPSLIDRLAKLYWSDNPRSQEQVLDDLQE